MNKFLILLITFNAKGEREISSFTLEHTNLTLEEVKDMFKGLWDYEIKKSFTNQCFKFYEDLEDTLVDDEIKVFEI